LPITESTDNTIRIAQDFQARVLPCPEKKNVFDARQIGADPHRVILLPRQMRTLFIPYWLSRIWPIAFETPGNGLPLPPDMFIPSLRGGQS